MEFTLTDFSCFDELVDSGFTVQKEGFTVQKDGGKSSDLRDNQQITCVIKMYSWDSSGTHSLTYSLTHLTTYSLTQRI